MNISDMSKAERKRAVDTLLGPMGALHHVGWDWFAFTVLGQATGVDTFQRWNDGLGKTHAEVEGVFERAAELMETA